jgi:hypothetical protein
MQKGKYKKRSWADLEAQGNYRVDRIQREKRVEYQAIPNRFVIPHYDRGTGTDIIVAIITEDKREILELREVTNWHCIAKDGQPIYMNKEKKDQYIKSLTKKAYFVKWGNSKKRLYPTDKTKRFMDISYESNLLSGQRAEFEAKGIEVVFWNRTDFLLGYVIEDAQGNRKAVYWDGTEVKKLSPSL